ncbi:MAG TPA: DUF2339 domain-containing protein [Gaiellaceae bacterium]|nr:DUF2339 domain-containing protein [Gaiellaceae bacterium]
MSEQLHTRLDSFERRLTALRGELDELRRLAGPVPAPTPAPGPRPARATRPEPPKIELPPRRVPPPAGPPLLARIGDALGARALAITGGAVTLLGVVLLFALAVNRGWIGPWERCGIGALASCIVFAGGVWLRSRYGQTYAALAAVGAGIGGAYATLLAAAALYHLLPDVAALVVAAGIAAVGVATAIAWSAQIVAGLGLIGAMLVPLGIVFDAGVTVLGTGFVAIMLVATGLVAVRKRWWYLLTAGVVASGAQIVALVWQSETGSRPAIALATVFWLTYFGLAIARQLTSRLPLEPLAASLAVFSAGFAFTSCFHLFDGRAEGYGLLVVATVYGAACSVFLARRSQRDLSSLLSGLGLAVGAVAVADLLSGGALAVAWSAEAAVLFWLASRIREPRFELGAIAYLALAGTHVLWFDAPLNRLFVATAHPGKGAIPAAAVALAAAIGAWFSARVREELLWTAGVLGTYAVSLGLLEVFTLGGSFGWGAVAVTTLWALEAAVLLVLGMRGGGIVLALVLAKVYVYDLGWPHAPVGYYSALAVGTIVLAAGYLGGRARRSRVSVVCVVAGADLLCIAVTGLLDGIPEGVALLGLGACYALLAATVLRSRRLLATWLWASGLVIVLIAWDDLLGGTPLVFAWAATGTLVAWLATRTGERRLRIAAEATIVLTLLRALIAVAPPRDLFVAGAHPADGVLALTAVAAAAAVLAFFARSAGARKPPRKRMARAAYRFDLAVRRAAPWIAGILAVEAVSLAILQVSQWLGSGSVHLEFQHGQTAVSAFWGTLGLAALYLGLTRGSRRLRRAGLAIFALSLAKIFLYDLSQLSSITRALSFLAVGAVLLLGGFFYQRHPAFEEFGHHAG